MVILALSEIKVAHVNVLERIQNTQANVKVSNVMTDTTKISRTTSVTRESATSAIQHVRHVNVNMTGAVQNAQNATNIPGDKLVI